MIKSIHIQNFESHLDSTLNFSPGLNVIVGLTDSGKSSIFRALQWLVYNKPAGSSMIPLFWKQEDWTEVEIEFDDGTKIAKRKKGNQTEYMVGEKRLTGFGRGDVPKDVLELVQMDDINFQPQIALPFLMFDTPGERSRVLNRVAGLDDIDRSLSSADSDTRRIRQSLDSERSLLSSLQSHLDRFSDLDKRDKMVKEAEQLEQGLLDTQDIHRKVTELLDEFSNVESETKRLSWVPRAEILVKAAQSVQKELLERTIRVESIKRAVNALFLIDEGITEVLWVEEKDVEKTFQKATSLLKQIKTTESKKESLLSALTRINTIDRSLSSTKTEIDSLSSSLPKRCPECGKVL